MQQEITSMKKTRISEGWYFKNISNNHAISFIPGISISKKERKAFIQVITSDYVLSLHAVYFLLRILGKETSGNDQQVR